MTEPCPKVLVCDDDTLQQASLARRLGDAFALHFVQDGAGLLESVARVSFDAIVLDVGLRSARDGFDVLPKLRQLCPDAPVIIHSGTADYASVVEAMRLGAVDYVSKDNPPSELARQLHHAMRVHAQPHRPPAARRGAAPAFLIGTSAAVNRLRHLTDRLRNLPGNVVISGESGVGKEVVAGLLRRQNDDVPEPWVDIDASTIAGNMAESTLFGHERGAFTGADRARSGLLEDASGGTVYLDEIANMPLEVQAKLLRVLQEKRVRRLGANACRDIEFRVVSATNRNLRAMCRRGTFRFDLYTRLDVFAIHVPPLRRRSEDVEPLVRHFIAQYGPDHGAEVTPEAMRCLERYAWPGNVRELANVVQYMLAMGEGAPLTPAHLPSKVLRPVVPFRSRGGMREQVKAFERRLLKREYKRLGHNLSRMARALEVDRSTLYAKLDEHGLRPRATTARS